MLNKDLKKLVKAFDEVKDTDFIKDCWNYGEYLWWGSAFVDIKNIKGLRNVR